MIDLITVGIDVGSMSTKVVIMDNDHIKYLIKPTGWSPRQVGQDSYRELLQREGYNENQVDCIVGTGYGRISLPFVQKVVTEITCHGKGAAYLLPQNNLVIDIGGQDSKVIKIDHNGKVQNFIMNDKCAAGTGRFLQVMANALGLDVSELGERGELSNEQEAVGINSMCTVFAESEVIGLLAQGVDKTAIVAALHVSIAKRVAAMAKRIGIDGPVTFTGGVARNEGIRKSLEKEIGVPVMVPSECQIAGALGAALIGREILLKNNKVN
jgi:predicted CoA-substrate-specific enzyme activase